MSDKTISISTKESFIKTIVLDPMCGSDFSRVATEAYYLAREKKVIVEFSFNDTKVTINGRGW